MLHGTRWILFDAVGTLMYADPPVADVYHAAGRRHGSRRTVGEIETRFRRALAEEWIHNRPTSESNERGRWRRIVASVFDDAPRAADALFEQLWRHFARPDSWRIYADVHAAFSRLTAAGFQLGIASNFDARLNEIVRGHPRLAACHAVFVSSAIGYTKPDPRFFQAIEAQLDVSPSEIALVGDDQVADVAGAASAGWRAIWLQRSALDRPQNAIQTLTDLIFDL